MSNSNRPGNRKPKKLQMDTVPVNIYGKQKSIRYERTKNGNISTFRVVHEYDDLEKNVPKEYTFTYDEEQNIST